MSVNDDKLTALETLTGNTGTVNDLEREWLESVVSAPAGLSLNDLWLQFFLENGATSGAFNDAAAEFLAAQGHTGSLQDRWAAYWAAGGGGLYDPGMMTFDGSTGYYSDTYTSSGNKVTVVARFNRTVYTGGGAERICEAFVTTGGSYRMALVVFASDHATVGRRNKLRFFVWNSSLNLICDLYSSSDVVDGADHVVFAEFDGDAGTGSLIIDGVDEDDTGNAERVAPTTGTLASGASEILVGVTKGTASQFFGGEIGYFGMRDIGGLDYTDFMSGSTPKELDESGWTEWGAQPLYWNDQGEMTDNKGSAGNMTENGTITGPA